MLPPRKGRPQGIALVIVMVVIFTLSVLAAGFSYSMKVETKLARNVSYESDLLWLGRSGVELARYVLAQQLRVPNENSFDSLNQKWAGGPGSTNDLLMDISLEDNELGLGRFSVEIEDLERKININLAPPELVERVLERLGCDTRETSIIVDSLVDWKDSNEETLLNGAETEDYLHEDTPHGPHAAKNGAIDDLEELLLVRGVTPELFWGSGRLSATGQEAERIGTPLAAAGQGLGLVDVFSAAGASQVNLNTASAEVLALLPGMDEQLAAEVVRLRAGLDCVDGTEDDTPLINAGELISVPGMLPQYVDALRNFCGVRSYLYRVRVYVELAQYQRCYVALLQRQNERSVFVVQSYWE